MKSRQQYLLTLLFVFTAIAGLAAGAVAPDGWTSAPPSDEIRPRLFSTRTVAATARRACTGVARGTQALQAAHPDVVGLVTAPGLVAGVQVLKPGSKEPKQWKKALLWLAKPRGEAVAA